MVKKQLNLSNKYSKFILSSIIAMSLIGCGVEDEDITIEEITTESGVDESTDNETNTVGSTNPEINTEVPTNPETNTEEPNNPEISTEVPTNPEISTEASTNPETNAEELTRPETNVVIPVTPVSNTEESSRPETNTVESTNPVMSTNPATPSKEEVDKNYVDALALLALVNQFRIENGQSRLVLNLELNKAALNHSKDMNVNKYFSHTGLDGSNFGERVRRDTDYSGFAVGENIAVGQQTVESVHNTWINSEGHRNNILRNGITEMGIGHNGRYWTQLFGITR